MAGELDRFRTALAAFGRAALHVDEHGKATAVEHPDVCEAVPESVCAAYGRTCGECPAYAAWRARLPKWGWA